jgi:hypothetical protein
VLLPLADRIKTITYDNGKEGLLQIEWVIFVILRAIPVFDGDAIADW